MRRFSGRTVAVNVVTPRADGDLREMRDQHRRQPAALHLVGDRERDLRPVGPLELEHRVRDDPLLARRS